MQLASSRKNESERVRSEQRGPPARDKPFDRVMNILSDIVLTDTFLLTDIAVCQQMHTQLLTE